MLVWTDPPGVADPALVNDLDLEVTVGGTTYKGNVFTGGVSTTGGSADTVNNVEGFFLPAGTAVGTVLAVKVKATALNGDGILGNADPTDQHYALVIYNFNEVAAPLPAAAGATLTNEFCAPTNGALDPGETVTVNLGLQNAGTLNTANLVATLQAIGGVTVPSGPQTYGTMVAGGPAISRPFTFTVNSALLCGGTLTATLQLQDGATNLGTATFTFPLGTTATNSFGPFSNAASSAIPNGAPTTTSGNANPYPSTINVSGVTGTISKVTVTLSGLSHTYSDDVDILLVGPGGQSVLLMSDAGSSGNIANVNLTFDDTAATSLPNSPPIVSGTYKPTNYTASDTFAAPAPASPYGAALSVFNGTNANGDWKLFVVDDASPDSGSITGGWSLNIQAETPVCNTLCLCPAITFSPTILLDATVGWAYNQALTP